MNLEMKPKVGLSCEHAASIPGFGRNSLSFVERVGLGRKRRIEVALSSFVFLMILLICPFYSNAQLVSKTAKLADGTVGQLNYVNAVFLGDTLKHGDFRFQAVEHDADNEQSFISVEYAGNYNKGLKDGKWLYRKAVVQKTGEPTVNGYVLQQAVEGEELVISGSFSNGEATDVWVSMRRSIVDGQPADTLEYVTAEFKSGNLKGKAQGYVDQLKFKGAFVEDGLLTGNWEFNGRMNEKPFKEVRKYEQGYFVEHSIQRAQKAYKLLHPDQFRAASDAGSWGAKALNAGVISVLMESNLLLESQSEKERNVQMAIVRTTNEVMDQALHAFGKRNGTDIWAAFDGSEPLGGPKMMVRRFPFSEQEAEALANSRKKLAQIEQTNQDFFSDPIVDVGRFAYEDVAFSYELLSQYKTVAQKLGEVIEKLQNPSYQYVNRELLFKGMGLTLHFPDSVNYEFDDTLRSRPWLFPWQGSYGFLSMHEIDSQLTTIDAQLSQLIKNVDLTLEDYKRESLLSEMEVQIIEARDEAIDLFERKTRVADFNGYHEQLAPHLVTFVMEHFKSYARLSPQEKLEASESVLTCFKDVVQLYEELRKQPLREENLTEIYTRTVWNAYTFTYMDELVKERLFRAYEEELLTAITQDLMDHLSCDNIGTKSKNYAAVYKRMQELREQDTKAEERQLRKSGGVTNLIAIFNFELSLGGGNL